MIALILAAQAYLNDTHSARLKPDGIPGPRTETAQRAATSFIRRGVAGCIPHEWGQISTYGGPIDYGDLYEGQSFFPIADPDGSGPKPAMYTPKDYYDRIVPAGLRGYLSGSMGVLNVWPRIKGKAVGVSFFLKTDEPGEYYYGMPVYYAAARLSGDLLVRVIDWGPTAKWTKALAASVGKPELEGKPWRFKLDIAPGAYRVLGLTAKADFCWWEVM